MTTPRKRGRNAPRNPAQSPPLLSLQKARTVAWRVIETEVFTDLWAERGLSESHKKTLKERLVKNPDRGDPIPGCGLLRKERMADPVRRVGARGGLRVIFSTFSDIAVVWLITVYGKDEQEDLPKEEVGPLCEAVKRLASEERIRLRRQLDSR